MRFVWDEEKNKTNILKHGISFDSAKYVFSDPGYIEIYDEKHSIDENRYIAIGCVEKILFVVYTERSNYIRLISARIATDKERRLYYDENGYN